MANTKISALTSATTPVAGTEVLPIVQSSSTKQVSIANLTAGRSVSGTSFVPTGSTIPANGLYLPAANAVGLATNTTNVVYIDASQNVGIGTAAPQEKLEVKTSTATQILVGAGSGFTYGIGRELTFGFLRFYGNQSGAIGYIFTGADGERMRIDSSGNVLVTSAAGLGYGTGSGGTVTQATSKSTGVTLNKPTGQITMNNAALLPATSVSFALSNSLIAATDNLLLTFTWGFGPSYSARTASVAAGSAYITVKNESAGSLSEALVINFAIIKGASS